MTDGVTARGDSRAGGPAGALVAYRHAAYDSPWWANPNSLPGRFHRLGDEPTQYWCLHPLGPSAEMLRHHLGRDSVDALDGVRLNLWAARLPADGLVRVGFDDCEGLGIAPEDLVGDDPEPTRALADRMRAQGVAGLIVPSAALPGTENVVLFGARVLHPYLMEPVTIDEVRTGHLSDGARPAEEVSGVVRWFGDPHPALAEWRRNGEVPVLDDPFASRW